MFHLSITGTKYGFNSISISKNMTLNNIRDEAKKFKKQNSILKEKKNMLELYLVYALLQYCDTNLLEHDIKYAKMSKL